MAEFDYAKLGLKCGLEIHQQLDTGKLFCRCPGFLREDAPQEKIRRCIRPVPSELGEYDAAAVEAFRKGLSYVYEIHRENCCMVDTDEEPPQQPNKEALETCLKIALMLKASIPDEILVMRKAVADGSNVSGFQRTALIAIGGELSYETGDGASGTGTGGKLDHGTGRIGMQTIVIEEDAGRQMGKSETEIVYRLDRLGIPLIELATAPEIKSPGQAGEVALAIGRMLRLTGKAKRGLGTIRQDLNVSIAGGARVEAKGVQELELIPEYVRREVQRQATLLEIKNALQQRGLHEAELEQIPKDVSKLLHNTECDLLKKGSAKGHVAIAVKLPKFAGLLGKEVQPGRRFGTELAGYIKAKAGVAGLFHSDELPKYGISEAEKQNIAKQLALGPQDGFALLCESPCKAQAAIGVILERCRQALRGVPEETRNALGDGNTEYSRPLPGAARMYPETDIRPVKISKSMLEELRKALPKSAEERKHMYVEKFKLSEKLAEKMKLSNEALLFEQLVAKGYDATATAVLLLEGLVQLKRGGIAVEVITSGMIDTALGALKKGEITKEVLLEVLGEWSKKPTAELGQVVSGLGISKTGSTEIEKVAREIVEKNRKMILEQKEHSLAALMGIAMKELRGKASGQEVSEALKKEMKRVLG